MSLEQLTHKYIGRFTLSSATAAGFLSALSSSLASTTYSDGSSRTIGAGVAWSSENILSGSTLVGSIVSPASSSLGHKMIYIGGAATGTPTMQSPDAYSSARVNVGLVKNAGSYVSWSNSNPWNSGSFLGYVGAYSVTILAYLHVYESQDTLWTIAETTTGGLYYVAGGALFDSESTSASTKETDGKLYGLLVSGFGSVGAIKHDTPVGNYSLLYHSTNNGYSHSYLFLPGTSTTQAIERQNINFNNVTAANFKNLAGEFVRQPIYFEKDGGGTWYGRLREVVLFPVSLSLTKFTLSSVVNGYVLSDSTATTGQSILLKA